MAHDIKRIDFDEMIAKFCRDTDGNVDDISREEACDDEDCKCSTVVISQFPDAEELSEFLWDAFSRAGYKIVKA